MMVTCRNYFVERAWISRLLSDSQLVAQDRRLGSDSLSVARLDEIFQEAVLTLLKRSKNENKMEPDYAGLRKCRTFYFAWVIWMCLTSFMCLAAATWRIDIDDVVTQ